MNKNDCYYVLSIAITEVVTDITQDALSFEVKKGNIITVQSLAMCDTIAEARKIRKQVNGLILKAVK